MLHVLGPSTGGIRAHVGYLQTALPAHGWEVSVAGPEGVMGDAGKQDAVVPIRRRASVASLWRSRRALRRLAADVDLVHAHGLTPGWMAVLAHPDVPIVLTVHNLVLDEVRGRRKGPVLRLLEGLLPARVDAMIAISEDVARRFGAPAHTWVIPPAGPPPVPEMGRDALRARFGIDAGAPLVVSVARLNPQKDLATLLRAMVYVHGAIPDARALVIGEGREAARLRRLAAELGLLGAVGSPAVVTFGGSLGNAADALAAADVVAVTSRWESGPLVLFEAMLLGQPVVTTPVGLASQLVTERVTGRLVPVGDPKATAAAIVEVLADRQAAAEMGGRAREVAREKVGPVPLVSAVADVYRASLLP